MDRAMWKGAINFGLVTIPISLGVAVRQKGVQFHQVHDADGGRIREKRVCELDGKEVPYDHVAKGFEVKKGQFIVVQRDELKAISPVADKTVAIETFVDFSEIDPVYFDRTYYVAPDAKVGAGAKAYALFADALEKLGRVAIARITISTKQHLCLLRASGGRLLLTTMVYPDEVVNAPEVPKTSPTQKELQLAEALMQSMVGHFEPGDYRDEHRGKVLDLLEKKAKGKVIEAPEEKPVAPVGDLLEALQQSLQAHGQPKAAARGRDARTERAPRGPTRRTRRGSRTPARTKGAGRSRAR